MSDNKLKLLKIYTEVQVDVGLHKVAQQSEILQSLKIKDFFY